MKRLDILAKPENLPRVLAFLNEGLAECDCEASKVRQLEVAIEEMYANVSLYAYADETGTISIEMELDPKADCMRMRFIDSGIAFNPLTRPDPNVKLPLRERQRGGLGVYIVKKCVDRVHYEYLDGKNVLTIEKRLA